jgi:6-phosphogluconolactonase
MNVVNQITAALAAGIAQQGSASFVVPGGSSPAFVFKALANGEYDTAVDWAKVTITLVDDRLVHGNHNDSNCKLIRAQLLRGPVVAAKFFPLTITGHVTKMDQPFDVTLLGMGLDGHFASLFPSMVGDAAMNIDAAPAIIQTKPEGDPLCPRISMNLPMILQSRLVFLLVKDAAKREVLRMAQTDQSLPVHYLITQTVKSVQIITE